MRLKNSVCLIATLSMLLSALTAAGQVTATVPYSVSVFATSVTGVYTQPDSIAVLGGHVFVGYGNNVSTTGSDGKSSTIVEYAMNGQCDKDVLRARTQRRTAGQSSKQAALGLAK
jgi:hypothetical protein